jgi:hypothetical protein
MKIWTKEELKKALENPKNRILNTYTGEFGEDWGLEDEDEAKIVYPLAIKCFEDNLDELHPDAKRIEYEKWYSDNPWGRTWEIDWGKDIIVYDEDDNEIDIADDKIYEYFEKCFNEAKSDTLDRWIKEDEIEVVHYDIEELYEMLGIENE